MKEEIQENLLNLRTNSKSLWHLSHNLLPLSYSSPTSSGPVCVMEAQLQAVVAKKMSAASSHRSRSRARITPREGQAPGIFNRSSIPGQEVWESCPQTGLYSLSRQQRLHLRGPRYRRQDIKTSYKYVQGIKGTHA